MPAGSNSKLEPNRGSQNEDNSTSDEKQQSGDVHGEEKFLGYEDFSKFYQVY